MGCISFFPSKNLGAFGDAGMVLTGDEGLARKLAALRVHGAPRKYFHEWVGVNSRLDSLQAAVLRVKLQYLDAETAGRQKNAGRYRANLAGAGLPIGLPQPASYQTRHVYNQFVIRAARRDQLKACLQENGVGSEIYYPLSLHQQACFRDLGYREGDFPESEKAAREVLALPVHSALTEQDVDYVCRQIRAFYA
jgi:dTDP-4-amino-4,6-dideoxygalactose transaminase